jgi:hypothetical protein
MLIMAVAVSCSAARLRTFFAGVRLSNPIAYNKKSDKTQRMQKSSR